MLLSITMTPVCVYAGFGEIHPSAQAVAPVYVTETKGFSLCS